MSRHGRKVIVEFCAALSVHGAHRMKNERFNEADHLKLTAGCKKKGNEAGVEFKNHFSVNFVLVIANTKSILILNPEAR